MSKKNKTSLIINDLITHYNLKNYSEFARFLGVAPTTVSSWISRDSLDYDFIYSKCVGVSGDWLLTHEGDAFRGSDKPGSCVISQPDTYYGSDVVKIPVMDVAGAAGITGYINPSNIDTLEYIVLPSSMVKKNSVTVCIKNKGESMSPTFYDYDKLVIRLLDRSEWISMRDEHVYFVVHREGGSYIKRVKNRLKRGFLVCMSDNVDKLSFPNFNIDHNDLMFIWHVDLHISAKMPNINDTYYHRIKNVEDRLEEMSNILLKVTKSIDK
jgi:hypothetical protein